MAFWPFRRKVPKQLSPTELRDQLVQAGASGSRTKLLAFCKQYKNQIAENVDFICKAPSGFNTADADAINRYVQYLGTAAQFLAQECNAPELWSRLCGTPDTNPLLEWDAWFAEIPQRIERLEHADMIVEARQFIDRAKTLEGTAARQHEAFLHGRLGDLLFRSGDVAGSIAPYQASLILCQKIGDIEGQPVYLNNLLEANRYLGNIQEAIRLGEEAIRFASEHGLDCDRLRRQVVLMQRGEPLCRVVVVRDNKELELDEFTPKETGRYEFQFRRNRMSLQMVGTLVRQGNELAKSGKLADGMEKYQKAMDVDPYDPDPVYQYGMCLMELGAYAKAKEAFAEVEQLAPGWFRCRFDRWMAESLDGGSVTEDEFRLVRVLEDGGLPPEQAKPMALKAIEKFPEFAAFHLFLGDICQRQGDKTQAMECYRKGISLAAEPDLKSRLLCAAAGASPAGSPERKEYLRQALDLKGSLVAKAMLAFIPLNS